MTTEENNNDAKVGAGYLKEKFLIGLSRFTNDEVERAIMKVTSHMLKAPNEKHMARLIQATQGTYNTGSVDHGDVNRYIVEELEKRSHTHNWVVVLKAYVALHRLMSEGSPGILKSMQERMGLFSIRNIKDLADTPEGASQKLFIEQYIRYLEERNIVQFKLRDHGIAYKLEADEFLSVTTGMNVEQLAPVFDLLVGMLEALNKIEFRSNIVDNFLTLEAYRKVVCDGKRLYQVLTNRVLYMLEHYEDFPLANKQRWFKLYQRFDVGLKLLARFFDQMNAANIHWGEIIPSLKLLPESLLRKLEDEIKYADVQAEDITAIMSKLSVEEDRGPRVGAATSPSERNAAEALPLQQQATPVTASEVPRAKAEPELPPAATVGSSATVSKRDVFEDLFSAPPAATPTPSASVVRPAASPTPASTDVFASWEPVKPAPGSSTSVMTPTSSAATPVASVVQPRPASPQATSSPSVMPSTATSVQQSRQPAPAADFDPFAVATAPPSQQQQPQAPMDFFFSNATPQQQYATRTANTAHPAPFSELAAQGRGKAW